MEILAIVVFVANFMAIFATVVVILFSSFLFCECQPYITRLSKGLQAYIYFVTFGALFILPGLLFEGQLIFCVWLLVTIVVVARVYSEEFIATDIEWDEEQARAARIMELSEGAA